MALLLLFTVLASRGVHAQGGDRPPRPEAQIDRERREAAAELSAPSRLNAAEAERRDWLPTRQWTDEERRTTEKVLAASFDASLAELDALQPMIAKMRDLLVERVFAFGTMTHAEKYAFDASVRTADLLLGWIYALSAYPKRANSKSTITTSGDALVALLRESLESQGPRARVRLMKDLRTALFIRSFSKKHDFLGLVIREVNPNWSHGVYRHVRGRLKLDCASILAASTE